MEGLERVMCVWRMELWLHVEVLVLLCPIEVEEDLGADHEGRQILIQILILERRGVHKQHVVCTSEASRAVHK